MYPPSVSIICIFCVAASRSTHALLNKHDARYSPTRLVIPVDSLISRDLPRNASGALSSIKFGTFCKGCWPGGKVVITVELSS